MIGFARALVVPLFAAVLVAASGCGGSVVFVEDGEGGSGGSGGTGTTSTKSTTTTSTMKTTSTQQSTTVGPMTTNDSVSVSVSTGPSGCDTGVPAPIDSFECQQCQDCTFSPGGACVDELSTCQNSPECFPYVECISNCGGQGCEQQCEMMYPAGFEQYWALVNCVLCVDCYNNCDGQSYCGFK